METNKNIASVIKTLLEMGAVMATKFDTPALIVRATRRSYDKKFDKKKIEIFLTIGKPNFNEREFIKVCKKAGEKFPIKKIQLKFFPIKVSSKNIDNAVKQLKKQDLK